MSSLCYLEREREGERGGKELSKEREVEKESGGGTFLTCGTSSSSEGLTVTWNLGADL